MASLKDLLSDIEGAHAKCEVLLVKTAPLSITHDFLISMQFQLECLLSQLDYLDGSLRETLANQSRSIPLEGY